MSSKALLEGVSSPHPRARRSFNEGVSNQILHLERGVYGW